jgi:1-phosphatidylinositol-4-phosphate 5-kinase
VSTINEEVRTTEYAPAIFQAIRKMDNITDEMVQKSLDTELNRTQVFKAKESAGKSGSFFFFSFDKQFLLKTMNDHEMEVFTNCLPEYYEHLLKYPDSLVARIYGVFTVRMEELVPVHILLMSNAAQAGKSIDYVFDLKGSEINREVKEKDITPGGTLKDQNLLTSMKSEVFLLMQKKDMRSIMNQIAHDIKFLAAHNLMDYSLLLIVETNPKWIEKMARK